MSALMLEREIIRYVMMAQIQNWFEKLYSLKIRISLYKSRLTCNLVLNNEKNPLAKQKATMTCYISQTFSFYPILFWYLINLCSNFSHRLHCSMLRNRISTTLYALWSYDSEFQRKNSRFQLNLYLWGMWKHKFSFLSGWHHLFSGEGGHISRTN